MSELLFMFGRTPELSFQELSAVIGTRPTRLAADVAVVSTTRSPEELIAVLGGTVKIAREKGRLSSLTAKALLPFFSALWHGTFGISAYGNVRIDTEMLRRIKEGLGSGARYVMPKEGSSLTSVVVSKQKIRELIIVPSSRGYIIGETAAVQDFEAWNRRDYGRPYADPKSGMLPPKVARMAVNLAGTGVLLDPFCGMGTILAEAALTGWKVFGSDQSGMAVEKAKKNLAWSGGVGTFFVSDATHVSEHVAAQSVDAIVTEPYLGPVSVGEGNVKNMIKGLEKLYIGCLKDWYRVLKPEGKVVIALPQYAVGGKMFFVKTVIDRCETLGYTVLLGPLKYSRPQAVTRRQFYVLQKHGAR